MLDTHASAFRDPSPASTFRDPSPTSAFCDPSPAAATQGPPRCLQAVFLRHLGRPRRRQLRALCFKAFEPKRGAGRPAAGRHTCGRQWRQARREARKAGGTGGERGFARAGRPREGVRGVSVCAKTRWRGAAGGAAGGACASVLWGFAPS
eukprot:363433-Chlamydomonas_euryale.AAC.5